MVTTPSHPARFALRGYTGRISPRGLGARVVGPAAPGCAPPGTPTALTPLPLAVPAVSPPLAPVAPPPSVAALETCAWSLAPEALGRAPDGGRSDVSLSRRGPREQKPVNVRDPSAARRRGRQPLVAGQARSRGGPLLPPSSPLPALPPAAPRRACADSSVSSIVGGPGSLHSAMRGTTSMTACRLRARKTERRKACRGFT